MNKMVMRLIELIRELLMVERILKEEKAIHMVVKGSSSFSSQKKKNAIESTKHKGKNTKKELNKIKQLIWKMFLKFS